jgi:hypothetical protein
MSVDMEIPAAFGSLSSNRMSHFHEKKEALTLFRNSCRVSFHVVFPIWGRDPPPHICQVIGYQGLAIA